jgi:hypothetical protein
MSRRAELAAKVAQCISQWSEIEVQLGAFLGLLLHANQKAAVAMYSGVENRAAQLRLILSAAEASVPSEHFELLSALMSAVIRPAMRERDRLAHWVWGFSRELPDALLLSKPSETLDNLMKVFRSQPEIERAAVHANFDEVFVVRDGDLDAIIKRSQAAKDHLRVAMATVWDHNTPQMRDEHLQQLSNVPEIHAALEARRKRPSGES